MEMMSRVASAHHQSSDVNLAIASNNINSAMVRGTAQEMTLMSEAAHQCLTNVHWVISAAMMELAFLPFGGVIDILTARTNLMKRTAHVNRMISNVKMVPAFLGTRGVMELYTAGMKVMRIHVRHWAVSNKSSSAVITHALEYSIVVIAVWIVLMGLMRTGVIMSADQISSVALMTGV